LLLYYLGPILRRFESKYQSQHTARTVEVLEALADEVERQSFAKVVLKGRHTVNDVRAFVSRGWHAWHRSAIAQA
jgi:hypothetical protein